MNAAMWFAASGAVIVLAGVMLTRAADAIADATGLGRLWIGSALLAAATSLPEAITDVAAVRLGAPDLGVGDLFGSSMANMLILAVLDLMPPRRRVLRQATLDHALAACLAILMTAWAGLLVFIRPRFTLCGVGPGSLLLLFAYLAGARSVFRHVRRSGVSGAGETAKASSNVLRRSALGFSAAAITIVLAAPMFASAAKAVADQTGLGTTFVGTLLVGISTSLPELVTSVAAVRMGAFDLAVGSLFGSNALNMAVIFLLDAAQSGPAIFAVVAPAHVLSAFLAVILTVLGLAAVVYRAEQRFAMVEPDSALVVIAYVLGVWLLYAYAVPHQ